MPKEYMIRSGFHRPPVQPPVRYSSQRAIKVWSSSPEAGLGFWRILLQITYHSRFRLCALRGCLRSAMKSAVNMPSPFSSMSHSLPGGTRLTRSSSRAIPTFRVRKRKALGNRTAWLRPFVNIAAVSIDAVNGIYHAVYHNREVEQSAPPRCFVTPTN